MNFSKIIALVCTTAIFISTVSAMWPVQSQVRELEQESEIDQSTIYTNITYRPIRKILESQCSTPSVEKAKVIQESAERLVDSRYGSDGAYLLTDTQQIYTLITRLHDNLKSFGDERYCTAKYVLNAIQLRLREIHLNYMEDTGLLEEFEWVNELDLNINAFDAKVWIFDMHIRNYRSASSRLGAAIQPKILNSEFINILSPEQEILLIKAQQLMEAMIAQTMLDLKERKFLSQEEINDLSAKIEFEYVAACGVFNGKYELKQVYRGDTLVSQAPNSLTFKINLCPSYFVIRDITDIYRKIITHELWHHIYYFTDDQRDEFTQMCRSWDKDRTNACTTKDFVTAYAQTSALEDYAEHFMHWFIAEEIWNTTILQQKSRHFQELENLL